MPECYRINDGLCRLAGVRILHSATATWLTLAGERLYERVQAIPGLPAEVRTGIVEERNAAADLGPSNEFKLRARLARALIDASRPGAALHASVPESKAAAPAALATSALGEPSWAALGRLIEELSFMQVYRRAEFERTYLAVSTDEFLESAAPLVAGHPCGDFLELLTGRRSRRNAALDRLGKLAADGMEFHWQPLVDKLFEERREARDRLYDCIMEQIDATAREMLLLLGPEFGGSRPANARRVLTVSPYSPLARAVLVESDWKSVAADAAEWEKAGAAHPRVLVAFARHYLASGRPDNTERLLKAAIRIEPAPRVYSELAEMYRDQGRHAEWLATVDECLTKPDYGLNHAMMCSNLARDLMDLGQWKKALPYAERAAQSYSASGLTTYAGCQEGLLDWAKAESATRAVQERYRESLEWYFFCRRTGQGDLDAARQSAQARVEREDWDVGVYRRALYYQLEKKLDKALRLTEGAYAKEKDSFDGIRLALLADELKDARKRDDTLRQVIKLGPRTHLPNNKPQKGTVIVANLLAKDLAAGGKGDIDQKAIQAALAVIEEPADRMNCRYFIGKYLDLRGKHAEGVQCWMKCMACPVVNATCRTLAGAELCGRGIRGEKFGALLQSGEADLPPAKSLPRAPRLW
jgi:tetratricopeptide (TPR) repeat protein